MRTVAVRTPPRWRSARCVDVVQTADARELARRGRAIRERVDADHAAARADREEILRERGSERDNAQRRRCEED
jgi:hypothetical protein